jgi:hypothetical protein
MPTVETPCLVAVLELLDVVYRQCKVCEPSSQSLRQAQACRDSAFVEAYVHACLVFGYVSLVFIRK